MEHIRKRHCEQGFLPQRGNRPQRIEPGVIFEGAEIAASPAFGGLLAMTMRDLVSTKMKETHLKPLRVSMQL